jgi:hypothetical protein
MAELFFTEQLNNPLGIGRGSSTPAAQKFGEDDVGTTQSQVGSGKQQLSRAYGEEAKLIEKQGGLEERIARDTANLVSYRNEQELFKAKQQAELARLDSENIKKILDEVRSSPLYKQKEETNKQIAEYSAFVPTEVTAPMLGVLFATIGATGMLLGGNNKNTAKAALSAMNGMAEGFGKGREQYDKERKQAFDSNIKLLQTKLSAIDDGLEDARKEAVLNKQAAELKVRETLAANDAQFLQENTNRRGLESTIELVKGQLNSLNKSLQLQQTKTRQIEGQLNRDTQALENRKIIAANSEATARVAAEQRQRELEARQAELTYFGMQGNDAVYVDKLGNKTLIPMGAGVVPASRYQPRAEPRTPAPKTGMQGGQLVQLPDARTLPVANLTPGAPTVLSPAAAAKTGQGEKAPAGIEKDIKQNAIIAENMRSTISSAEDLAKKGKLKSFGFIEGRIPYDVVQQFTSPEELRFIAQMNSLTNQQLKLQSGATVTAAEFARQRGVLPLVTDNPETVVIKLKLWQELIDTETRVLGRAYPETVKKYSGTSGSPLAQRMDQAGATPGRSDAEYRDKAQKAILNINNRTDIDQSQKQELIGQVNSTYKSRTGMDL